MSWIIRTALVLALTLPVTHAAAPATAAQWGYGTAASYLQMNLDQAERHLLAAYAQQPTNADIALALANLMGTSGRTARLIPYLNDILRYETDVATRKWATDTLAKSERFLADKKAADAEEERQRTERERAKPKKRKWW